ncbi:MAG: DUF2079 domain-containing protein [Chloroflexota bacterium]
MIASADRSVNHPLGPAARTGRLLRRAWDGFTIGRAPSDRLGGALALLAMVAFGVFFCVLASDRFLSYHAEAFDLGIEDQMMWTTLHGHLFGITLERRLTTSYFGYHFEPFSLIGPVLYLIYDSPLSLIVFKNVVVALGAIPAFWLARKHLGSAYAGLVFALVYLLFPGLEAAQMYDWHAYTLTAPFLLAAFCFLESRRYGWLIVFLALAASTKENAPLDAVPLGAYLFLTRRKFRLGAVLAVAGLAWFAVGTYLVVPHFNSQGQAWLWTRYAGMGGSPLDAVVHFVKNPNLLLAPVPADPNWHYVALLLAPVAWLTLLSPTALFLMVPALAVNVLTAYYPMHLIETYHYSAHLVPFVLLGAVYGIGTVGGWVGAIAGYLSPGLPPARGEERQSECATALSAAWGEQRRDKNDPTPALSAPGRAGRGERGNPARAPRLLTWALCTIAMAATLVYHHYRGYTPLSGEFVAYPITAHDRLGDQLARTVAGIAPVDTPLSAQTNLYPHVSHRPDIWMFPEVDTAKLIFLDVSTLPNTTGIDEGIHDQVRQVLDSGAFGVVRAEDGYLILERGAPRVPLPDAFYSFARATNPRIQHPLDVLFGDKLELLGFDVIPDRDGKVNLRAYWRARAPITRDLSLTFYITDGDGTLEGAALHREPANYWYPTNRWQPGEIVQVTTYNLPVGRRGKDFGVALGAQPGADPFDTAGRLRPTVLSAPSPLRTPGQGALLEVITFHNDHDVLSETRAPLVPAEKPEHALDASFDQGVSLRGYSLSETGDRSLNLHLFWGASGPTSVPYTVFAHLVDGQGKLIAQHDAPPDGGLKSTTAWLKGEVIDDQLTIALPAGISLANSHLEIGLYDPVTGRRLSARQDGKAVDHLTVPVRPWPFKRLSLDVMMRPW